MKETTGWSRLDNAAKIFPPTSTRRDTKVFRFSCELYEDVSPTILQSALEKTLELFPFYNSVLKKGLFWHYLEQTNIKPIVREENKPLCAPLYNEDKRNLLYEVSYYKKRINIEIYHALTDGTGAVQFFRTLVFHYLKQKHKDSASGTLALDYDAPLSERSADSFSKYYDGKKIKLSTNLVKAYRIKGERLPAYRLGVIEGRLNAEALLKKSKEYGLTLSEFITALIIYSIHATMSEADEKRPVSIMVPVNLRSYFPTDSARNFFSTIKVRHFFLQQGKELKDIMENTKNTFKAELTKENISAKMNSLSAWEHSFIAQLVPLMIKIYVLKVINRLADKEITASFSNLGRISMPEEVSQHIKLFDVFISTKRLNACLNTFGETVNISIASSFVDSGIEKHFFRTLASLGLDVKIVSNLTEY